MKTLSQHIKQIHSKPHHVRKQVAFTIAGVGTAFVALIWLGISLGTGAFALKSTSFADSTTGESSLIAGQDNTQALAGAAAASGANDSNGPARIEIIDAPSGDQPVKPEQTTISF